MHVYAEFHTSYQHKLTVTQSSNAAYDGTWLHIQKKEGAGELPACDVSVNMNEYEVRILIAALQNRLNDID